MVDVTIVIGRQKSAQSTTRPEDAFVLKEEGIAEYDFYAAKHIKQILVLVSF